MRCFVPIEPCELTFSVNVFQPDWPIDHPDTKHRKSYRELCEDSGWKYATYDSRYYVYYKDAQSEAIPIHTDPQEEYKTITKAFLKGEAFIVLILLIQIFQFIMNIRILNYSNFISNGGLFMFLNPMLMSLTLKYLDEILIFLCLKH